MSSTVQVNIINYRDKCLRIHNVIRILYTKGEITDKSDKRDISLINASHQTMDSITNS